MSAGIDFADWSFEFGQLEAADWDYLTSERATAVRLGKLAARQDYRQWPSLPLFDALIYADTETKTDRRQCASMCAEGLRAFAAGMPAPALSAADLQRDARLWAGSATGPEMVAYLRAIAAELPDAPASVRARKALFAELWAALPAQDRRAFLERADPGGKIRRAG